MKNRERPKVFIASSSEGKSIAEVLRDLLQSSLKEKADVYLWVDSFPPSDTNIESLEKTVEQADFAVSVLTCDDKIESRGGQMFAPRDNVLFELGLFMGRIGRKRCYLITDDRKDLKLPSDLLGVNSVAVKYTGTENLRDELAKPSVAISKLISDRWIKKKELLPSAIAAQEASGVFCERIKGHWWSIRNWDKRRLGFVSVDVDPPTGLSKVKGDAYDKRGQHVAHWDSVACCVHTNAHKVYYYFDGYHPETRGRPVEKYEGFTEYEFKEAADRFHSGTGVFSDRNLADPKSMRTKTLTLLRCTDKEVDKMTSGIPKLRGDLVNERLDDAWASVGGKNATPTRMRRPRSSL
jgi:hypothetical protein